LVEGGVIVFVFVFVVVVVVVVVKVWRDVFGVVEMID